MSKFRKIVALSSCITIISNSTSPILAVTKYDSSNKQSTEIIKLDDKDNKPKITWTSSDTIELGSTFDKMSGVKALDKDKNDITKLVSVEGEVNTEKVGEYLLEYSLTDDAGEVIKVSRTITVVDSKVQDTINNETENKGPKIIGSDIIRTYLGEEFDSKFGITATDENGKDITDLVTVEGKVKTDELGSYELKYSVVDELGKTETFNRKVHVINKNVFNVYIEQVEEVTEEKEKQLGFSIYLDTKTSKFAVENQSSEKLNPSIKDEVAFKIRVLDKDNKEKLAIELLGEDTGDSEKLNALKELEYSYGDFIEIHPKDIKDGFSIDGPILGDIDVKKEDYVDGVDNTDYIKNVRFKITEEGIESVYNNAPEISGLEVMDKLLTDRDKQLEGVKVTDDHDGDISNDNIQIVEEKDDKGNVIGLRYTVSDNWGRNTSNLRLLKSATEEQELLPTGKSNSEMTLSKNIIEVHGVEYPDRDTLRFKLKFNQDTKKIEVTDKDGRLFDNKVKDKYFELIIYDKYGNRKETLTLNGSDRTDSKKLSDFDGSFDFGDQIHLYHKYSANKLIIKEKIVDFDGDANSGIDPSKLIDNRFELAPKGLKYLSNNAPTITWANESTKRTITRGQKVDLRDDIIVTDDIDGEIDINRVSVTDYNPNQLGDQTVTYRVKDSWGVETTKDRTITVVADTNLSQTSIDVMTHDGSKKVFSIKFDDFDKRILINNKSDNKLDSNKSDELAFKIRIFSKAGITKKDIRLNGGDTGLSKVLEELHNYRYTIGDTIELWSSNPESSLKIMGPIEKQDKITEDSYEDGIQDVDFMNNVRFELKENTLYAKYNEAPEIVFKDDLTIRRGEEFDPLSFIEEVKDDHDSINKKIVRAYYDKNKIHEAGEYDIEYRVSDKWGKSTSVTKTITVLPKNKLEETKIKLLKEKEDGTKEPILTLSFDDINKTIVKDIVNNSSIPGESNTDVFKIRVFDSSNKLKAESTIKANEGLNNTSLEEVLSLQLESNDVISVSAYKHNNLVIDGEVTSNHKNSATSKKYENGFTSDDKMNNTRFRLTPDGFKELYNEAPEFKGAEDTSILKGDKFEPLEGVSVTDDHDVDIPKSEITVTGNIDSSKLEPQILTYKVSDSWGRTTEKTRTVTVQSKAVNNEIELKDINGKKAFKIGFDFVKNKFKVSEQSSDPINQSNTGSEFFIAVADRSNNVIKQVELKGTDNGNSSKLNELNDVTVRPGYRLFVWAKDSTRLSIKGHIEKDSQITEGDYSDGVGNPDFIRNVGFTITEEGLKAVYNKAPEILISSPKTVDNKITLYKGDDYRKDLLNLVGVNDDHDGVFSKESIKEKMKITLRKKATSNSNSEIELDKVSDLGEYIATYTIQDSWGRNSSIERDVKIAPSIDRNEFVLGGFDGEGKPNKELLSIKLNSSTMKFELEVIEDNFKFNKVYPGGDVYQISLYGENGTQKGNTIKIVGGDEATSSKFDPIKNWNFEYGDYIVISGGQVHRGKLNGVVRNGRQDYSTGFYQGDMPNTKFHIKEEGLVVEYNPPYTLEDNNNVIEFVGTEGGIPIRMDINRETKQITVSGDNTYYDYYGNGGEVLRIAWHRKNGDRVSAVSRGHKDRGPDAFKDFEKHQIEDGDYFVITSRYPEKTRIHGKLLKEKESYSDGVNDPDLLTNVRFTFKQKEGSNEFDLEATYNEAPKFSGVEDANIYVGDTFDPRANVEATDDNDGNIINYTVTGNHDNQTIGKYPYIYSATDSWGRRTEVTRNVYVRPQIFKNRIMLYAKDGSESTTTDPNDIKPAFEIGVDNDTGKYTVTNQLDKELNPSLDDDVTFRISIYGNDGAKKGEVELNGTDTGISSKLEALKSIDYSGDDYIRLWSSEAKHLRVTGPITGDVSSSDEDYNNGIDNDDKMKNVAFKVSDNGMSTIYNEAPVFNNLDDTKEILFGEDLDLLKGVTITDDKDTLSISDVRTTGEVNKDEIGSYKVTHTVTDRWGRSTSKEVTYKVVPKIKQNSIEVYGNSSSNIEERKFTLKFNVNTNKIDVEKNNSATESNSSTERYFEIVVRSRDTNVRAKVTFRENEMTSSDKLDELKSINYSSGDTISVYSNDKKNIKIKGSIEKSDGKNFDEQFPGDLEFNNVRFKITNKGLELFKREFPNITFNPQNLDVTRGDEDGAYEGIGFGFTNEDSYQGIDISIKNFDPLKLGTQKAEYVLRDSWGSEVSAERTITVVEPNELEKNKIKLLNNSNKRELLEFDFDTIEKKIVLKKSSNSYSGSATSLITLKTYDETGVTKHNITITPNNLSTFKEELEFDYGDLVSIYAYDNKNGLSITGKIKDQKEDYSDGVSIEDNIVNVRFRIQETGLESIYNNAPEITIDKELILFKDESPDLYAGVEAKDSDPHDSDVNASNADISTDLDITHIGEYTATYTVVDNWGRKSQPAERNIVVKSSLENNKIGYYAPNDTKNSAFDITIDNKNNKLKVQKNYTTFRNINKRNASKGSETIFEVKLFEEGGKAKKALTILSNDNTSSVNDKLKEFNNTSFEYGDYISVFAKDNTNGIKILGNIDKPLKIKEDYSDGIEDIDFMNNVRFRIDEEALEAVYNEAPKMTIPNSVVEVYKGDEHDLFDGIRVSDDNDRNLRPRDIIVSEEDMKKFDTLGTHTIDLILRDSWGRQVQGTRTFTVKSSIDRNEIIFGTLVNGKDTRDFARLGFDSNIMRFVTKKVNNYTNYLGYWVKIYDHNDKMLINQALPGGWASAEDFKKALDELGKIELKYGYYIKLDGLQRFRMAIEGPVRNQREDYSDRVDLGADLLNTKFYITEEGLRAEYTSPDKLQDNESLIEFVGTEGEIPLKIKLNYDTNKRELLSSRKGYFHFYNDTGKAVVFKIIWHKKDGSYTEFPFEGKDHDKHQRVLNLQNFLNSAPFEDGDYITFESYNSKNLRISGKPLFYGNNIEEEDKEDLSDGIDKEYLISQTRFYLNKDGEKGITVERLGSPRIEGAEDIEIKQGEVFNAKDNVKALDFDGSDLTSQMEVTGGNINTNRIGLSEVVYKVKNSNNITTTVTRNVNVYSEASITMKDTSSTPYIEQGTSVDNAKDYLKPLAQAIDPDGGQDISDRIEVDVKNLDTELTGTYKVTYSVTNDHGKTSTLDVDVEVGRRINVSVPTQIPFQVVTNLLDKDSDPFISGVLKITNNNTSEVDVSVKSFTKQNNSGDLEIVSPDSIPNWDELSKDESMSKMALGMYVKSGFNGRPSFIKDSPLWLESNNTNETRLGSLPRAEKGAPHEARLSFTSKHGKDFKGGTSKGKFDLVFKFE